MRASVEAVAFVDVLGVTTPIAVILNLAEGHYGQAAADVLLPIGLKKLGRLVKRVFAGRLDDVAKAMQRRADDVAAKLDEATEGAGAAVKGAFVPPAVPKKRGPKTDPNAPHNAKIREEAEKLVAEGNEILSGGGRRERLVDTPGSHKSARRPDIEYRTPAGERRARNVGLTKADGTPVTRELEALEDLNGPGEILTDFVPYDPRPPVSGQH